MNASTNQPARESAARIVAIDLAKDVSELAFANAEHRIVARKRLARGLDHRDGHQHQRRRSPPLPVRSPLRKRPRPDAAGVLQWVRRGFAAALPPPAERPHTDVRAGLRSMVSAARG